MLRVVFGIILIILLLTWGCSKAPLPPESDTNVVNNDTVGEIKVTAVNKHGISVDSVKIYLNGDFKGYTPLSITSVEFGTHTIRAQKQGFEIYSETVIIEKSAVVNREIILNNVPLNMGQLMVTIDQDSAKTTITTANDEIINSTYARELLLTVDTGGYFIRCEKPGYGLVFKAIEIRVDSITIENIKLEKLSEIRFPQLILAIPDSGWTNEPVLITWESSNTDRVDIDYVENPGLSGKREVRFQSSGLHYIKATGYNSTNEASVLDSIYISDRPRVAPQITITVSPKQIFTDEVVTITWNSTNAVDVDVDYVPNAGLSGQWQEQFYYTGIIVIEAYAYGPGGEAVDRDTITVHEPEPPTIEFWVEKDEVDYSEPIVLNWNTNGYKVIIDQGVGTRGPEGNEEVVFNNPGLKQICATAYGAGDLITTKKIEVRVLEPEQPELPVLSLSVIEQVESGQPALIEWHSWNAIAMDVDYVQNPGLNGKIEVVFESPGQRIISASAYNSAGQVTVSDTVLVVETVIEPQVETVFAASGAKVCAIHYSGRQSWENAAEVDIVVPGYYRVIAAAWYNSGDDQKNESFFLTINDDLGMPHYPTDANAGIYKVVADDPGAPHVAERNAGIFRLSAGKNFVNLHHYYIIADQYPQFVVNGPITDAESIQILYFKLEYVSEDTISRLTGKKDVM